MALGRSDLARLAKLEVIFQPEPLLALWQRRREPLKGAEFLPAEALGKHDYESMLAVTGWSALRPGPTFIDEAPLEWLTCTEPQITGGWALQLAIGARLQRCQALFDAVSHFVPGAPKVTLSRADTIIAEEGRVDLFVVATCTSGKRYAICIEAKFGHFVTEGQLDKSHRYVERTYRPHHTSCLIVAPELTADTAASMSDAKSWHFASWKRFLIAYDNALSADADSPAFRQFRSTCHSRNQKEIG